MLRRSFFTHPTHLNTIVAGGIQQQVFTKSSVLTSNYATQLKKKRIAIIGYGPQGRSQSLNLRDSGYQPILGLRSGESWESATRDGWIPGTSLFSIEEAVNKSNVINYLLSDAGQVAQWDCVRENLHAKDTLCFSHGFGIVFFEKTKIIPPSNIDVIMVAPKGSGNKLREGFTNEKYVNASFAVHQDYSKIASQNAIGMGMAIGCNNMFETTFEKEVYSDLTGERCVLMGLIQGAFKAQYDVLRENGHSPLEAYNETIEEALEHLYPMISEKGMDSLYQNCSTTAQVGAIEWADKFEKVLKPVIEDCYKRVVSGEEAQKAIDANTSKEYKKELREKLNKIKNQEMWGIKRQVDNQVDNQGENPFLL